MKRTAKQLTTLVLAIAILFTALPTLNLTTADAKSKLSFPKSVTFTNFNDKRTIRVKGLSKKQTVKFKVSKEVNKCVAVTKHKTSVDLEPYFENGSGTIKAIITTKGSNKRRILTCVVTVDLEDDENDSDSNYGTDDNEDDTNDNSTSADKETEITPYYDQLLNYVNVNGISDDVGKMVTFFSSGSGYMSDVYISNDSADRLYIGFYMKGDRFKSNITFSMPRSGEVLILSSRFESLSTGRFVRGYATNFVQSECNTQSKYLYKITDSQGYWSDSDAQLFLNATVTDLMFINDTLKDKFGFGLKELGFTSWNL